ncbi:division/cell wall cluster transcriptional repressor MraZ [Occultella gossypii]|uniref:Transcriptional regulator MraZ n=1 Tax=Occultella gossypii TaxID=2800820 RepID=A0ABS7SFV9_9MICO|nr:division/cell wall cluster transcriptional repressor MraZ [Occultella gossypii]MBZ2199244.1 division/cell wall cluster transcriptional repressor MraZ [Occultella gossypii]
MFLGTYEPRLDEKGRLILPAKFRDEMAPGVFITRGQDRCLYAFPRDEFERVHTELRQASSADKRTRDYMRVFLSGASEEIPDRQGRVTIPANLRKYAGLNRELAVIGTGTRIEIWDAEAWATYLEASEQAFADISEEVIPGL